MAVSKGVRFEVFKRDLFTCQYCGRRPPDVVLEVDHIIARSSGGSDESDNLATSCMDCNRGKSDRDLNDTKPVVDELTRLAAMQEMGERAELLKRQQYAAELERLALDDVEWDVFSRWATLVAGVDPDQETYDEASVRKFCHYGMVPSDFDRALDVVASWYGQRSNKHPSEVWRYFCGVCWKMLRERGGA